MTAQPVTPWENAEVNGLALCHPRVLEGEMEKVQNLRERQAKYLASLPTAPEDCLAVALGILQSDKENDLPEGLQEAVSLSFAVRAMVAEVTEQMQGPEIDAMLFLAARLQERLQGTVDSIKRVCDVLGNPAKLAFEKRTAAARQEPH